MTTASETAGGGFVRMPMAWLRLPISPQAKTLLMTFCGFANDEGRSWYSYEQLGEILQRSKASVANYVAELREHGLIECTRQTYGNGYNYRLLIKVIGWAELVRGWSDMAARKRTRTAADSSQASRQDASDGGAGADVAGDLPPDATSPTPDKAAPAPADAVRKAERRIQPTERNDPKGQITKIKTTQTPRATTTWTTQDERAWKRFRPCDRDPIDTWDKRPDPDLLRKTIAHCEALSSSTGYLVGKEAEQACRQALEGFQLRRRLAPGSEALENAARALSTVAKTNEAIAAAITALDAAWAPHWKRMSSPHQILETVSEAAAAAMPSPDALAELVRFRSRAWVARIQLRELCDSQAMAAA